MSKLAHESVLAGHFATMKTVSRTVAEFWWPGCQADCTGLCKSCGMCQRAYPRGKITKASLRDMSVINVPFQRIAVVMLGNLNS